MYKKIFRPLLFLLEAERAHRFVFTLLKAAFYIPGKRFLLRKLYDVKDSRLERTLMGLQFKNPVGLAAGFDKNALLSDDWSCFGFGFAEIGTVTPRPQPGNAKPRLFRLCADEALINRMGFNNDGVEAIAKRLRSRRPGIIIGGNIGKNKNTPNDAATGDYIKCFRGLFDVVDYFAVNVSSPNTPGLRSLQEKEPLTELLFSLQEINSSMPVPKPILLKIAPDLNHEQLDDIIDIVLKTKLSGIIATNTSLMRSGLKSRKELVNEQGGLSGKPIRDLSTQVVRYLAEKSSGRFVIVASGGIFTPEDALDKIRAGADLVQVYTGFIYEGPAMVRKINNAILKSFSKAGRV